MQDILQEDGKKQEVVLNVDDVRNIRDFFAHFKLAVIPELEEVLTRWESKKDKVVFSDQEDLKVALCQAMLQSEHPMFKDELFATIVKNSQKIVYDATFKRELEGTLTKTEE